jgi:Flp pilus assembly protein TadG
VIRRAVRFERRGAVAVQTAVTMVLLLSMSALTVDLGNLYTGRTQLQMAADSSALAGASAYTSDTAIRVYAGSNSSSLTDQIHTTTVERARTYSEHNYTLSAITHVADQDIVTGHYDFANPSAALDTSNPATFNAVQVRTRRTADGLNGPVQYFFASILGHSHGETSAVATAALDDRFVGYQQSTNGLIVPFAMKQSEFDAWSSSADGYSYNSETDEVSHSADGTPEIKLFPWRVGGGNFGILNIGTANQGTPPEVVQIMNGVQPSSLELEIGTSNVVFVDESGTPITYHITGSPGVSNGLVPAIESRIGDVIGFFLYSTTASQGSNLVYTITGLRFGRVMDLIPTGALDDRQLVIQPASVVDTGVSTGPSGVSTHGLVARLVLVK